MNTFRDILGYAFNTQSQKLSRNQDMQINKNKGMNIQFITLKT